MLPLIAGLLIAASADVRGPVRRVCRPDEDNPKEGPTTLWKADLQLTLERSEQDWVFVLRGTATVPEGVALRARVYAVEVVGRREDEEPLVWEDEDRQPALRPVRAGTGRFRAELARFARRPLSIPYRARLHYRPRDQNEETLERFGADEWSYLTDLRVGSDARFDEECRLSYGETCRDFGALDGLFRELQNRFESARKAPDPEAWSQWKAAWLAQVDDLDARNALRFSLWAVYTERQAKMRVRGLCELNRRLVRACTEELTTAAPDVARIQELMRGWWEYFEEGADRTGATPPLDPRIVPLLADYERAFVALRTPAVQDADEGRSREARRKCLSALFQMIPLVANRKTAYPVFNELGAGLARVVDAGSVERASGTLEKALEEHDRAFRDIQRLAALR